MSEYVSFKWGTLKAWNFEGNQKAMDALQRYCDAGKTSFSAMTQKDNEEQKQALFDIIDCIDPNEIWNDWTGEKMTPDEAKEYIKNYGK